MEEVVEQAGLGGGTAWNRWVRKLEQAVKEVWKKWWNCEEEVVEQAGLGGGTAHFCII